MIPPLIGFFSKQFVLYSAIQNGYYFISIVAIIVSVISASYYLKIIRILYTTSTEIDDNNIINTSDEEVKYLLSNFHSLLISILTLSILLFILKPSIILNSIHLIALNIFYF